MVKLDIERRSADKATSLSQSSCSGNHRNKNWLEEKYLEDNNSLSEVSIICGCSRETIRTWLKKHNIDRRNYYEKVDLNCSGKHKDSEWLEKKYKKERSIYKLSDICGCSPSTIHKNLKKIGVDRIGNEANCSKNHLNEDWLKNKFIEDKLSIKKIASDCGCSNTVIRKSLDEFNIKRDHINTTCNLYHRDITWMKRMYKDKTMREMANRCGCSQETISYWLDNFNIETSTGLFNSGENHWNYKDGKSAKEFIDFRKTNEWKKFSKDKKEEANWKCEYCNDNGMLHTHHVFPVSLGGDEWDNKFKVLCKNCHINNYSKWHPPQLKEYIQ